MSQALQEAPAPRLHDEAFGELLRRVKRAGLFESQNGYYVGKVLLNLAMLAGGWTAFVMVGQSWWQVVVAVALAFCYTQTGFVGHDIGHRQVARSRRWQDTLGLVHGNLLLGFSYGWWVGHHNKHHSNPNHLTLDSDITRRRVIFVPEQGPTRTGAVKKFIVRFQHVLFFPLLLLEPIGLRAATVRALRDRMVRLVRLEAVLIVVHLAGYVAALALVLTPAQAVVFVIMQQGLFGLYIGAVFAPNHKGMPIQREGEEWDWLTRQVLTSRNIRSTYLTDFFFGGLNYQIEHHLFPAMPRRNLRAARPVVMAYCAECGLAYHEVSMVASYAEVIRHLFRTTKAFQAGEFGTS